MGSIVARPRKSGGIAYLAKIQIERDGKIYRESKTFDRRQPAAGWIARREAELTAPGAVAKAQGQTKRLRDAIDAYVRESRKKIGRTKEQVLRSILTDEIADMPCHTIQSRDVVAFGQRLAFDRQPQTVSNYLSHLGAVFAIARPAWGFDLDPRVMADAIAVTRRLGVTGKSPGRDRRPTLDELDRIMTHFARIAAARPSTCPMHRVVAFALFSTRRQEEITRIEWRDLDEAGSRVMVRDMKHPGDKIGNNVWCDLPAPALAIIQAMPRGADQIFPFGTDAISAAFTRACKALEIEDLHFHDLRHEGVSRLFEMGLNIPHVAAVSGHRSWNSLRRYTHLRQSGDKFEAWPWIANVAASAETISAQHVTTR